MENEPKILTKDTKIEKAPNASVEYNLAITGVHNTPINLANKFPVETIATFFKKERLLSKLNFY